MSLTPASEPARDEAAFAGQPVGQAADGGPRKSKRIPILDGWRAVSILLVLAAHLLPLGPKILKLNHAAGVAGMALFFTLSGFLITSFLLAGTPISRFLVKRMARIVPLCCVALLVLLSWGTYDSLTIARNFLFVANLPPASLLEGGEHLWSLGVEMQFYLLAALLCLTLGRNGLYLLPVLGIIVTTLRVDAGETVSIVTWHRVDEILAGSTLALIYHNRRLPILPVWPLAALLIACSHPESGPLQYARPYAAAALIGSTMITAPALLNRFLTSAPMRYVAEISYALYVIHGVLSHTWLGTGDTLERYLKRPLLFAATFAIAHLSTRYFEQPITRAVRRMKLPGPPAAAALRS